MTPAQIGAEVEAFGMELIALRRRMQQAAVRLHRQAGASRQGVADGAAWLAYLALNEAGPGLYSRGHKLKRLGRTQFVVKTRDGQHL